MIAADWPLPQHAFHLADVENWPSIERTGLLSTAALIARAGLSARAARPYTFYRDRAMRLPSGELIRDQRPMPPDALARCLDAGLSPAAWYRLVNARVFFWLSVERLQRHVAACAGRPQMLVVVDLAELTRRHGARAAVTPFNVGNARRRPAPRGRRTFVPLDRWLFSRWQTEARPGEPARGRHHPPAELAVEGAVPDLMALVVDARPIAPGEPLRVRQSR
jgi:hypothetical protein